MEKVLRLEKMCKFEKKNVAFMVQKSTKKLYLFGISLSACKIRQFTYLPK